MSIQELFTRMENVTRTQEVSPDTNRVHRQTISGVSNAMRYVVCHHLDDDYYIVQVSDYKWMLLFDEEGVVRYISDVMNGYLLPK